MLQNGPLINHPKGKFFDSDLGKNKNIPLWQAVRASSAAPTYFAPQMISVMEDQQAAFIDGGLSMANNPALTLLMIATLKGFPFHWKMGEENILLVSVGTGYSVFKKYVKEIDDSTMLSWAANIPDMLMQDASWQNRVMLQWLSRSPTADIMDMEIEDMREDFLGDKPLISYLRYNICITTDELNKLGLKKVFTEADAKSITDMSRSDNRQLLYQIGHQASSTIKPEHFDAF